MENESNTSLAGESESTGLSMDEAAARVAGLLDDTDDKEQAQDAAPAGDDAPANDAPQAEGEADTQPDPEAETQAAPEAPKATDEDPEVILRDNTKVKLSELKRIAGDQAGAMQRFNEAVQAKQAEIQQREARLAQTEALAAQAYAIMQAQIPPPPSQEMWDTDPIAAVRQQQQHTEAVEGLRAFQHRMMQQQQQSQVNSRQAVQQHLAQEHERLLEKLPALKDEKVRTDFLSKMHRHLSSAGFKAEEIENISDHRIFTVLDKAMKYDELMAKKPVVQQKTQAAAPVAQPQPRAMPGQQKATAAQEAKQRALRTGREADAIAAIARML